MPTPLRRIVIDGRRLTATRTGVGRYLESLLSEWATIGLPVEEVHVVLANPSGLARVPSCPGLTAEVMGSRLPGLLWERFCLGRCLQPGDLLFAPTNLVPANWAGPTVLVMFDALQEVRPQDFSRMVKLRFGSRYRRALQQVNRVIVPSRATASDLQRVYGISEDRLAVVYPAPDRSFRQKNPGELASIRPSRPPFFLFVGKRSRRRNVPAILDAFSSHRARFPDHQLIFVGDTSGPGIPSEIPGVIDLGHVDEATLHALLSTAIALLYPSEHEGFGLPVVEGMATGCPVVTLRHAAIVEAGGDGPLYLDDASPQAIGRAMQLLATDSRTRTERIDAGLIAASRFTPEAFARGVTRELRGVWDDASGSSPSCSLR